MNQEIFYYLNSLAGKSACFDSLIIFFAQYLGYWLVAGVFVFLILGRDKKKEIKMLILAVLSVFLSRIVITEIIRFFYFVPRPFASPVRDFISNGVYQLIFHETNGSFPSGHAAFFFALAMAIFFFHKRWSILFFAGAILIGVARIIVGIHWPMDILSGAIIGILSSFFIYQFFKIKNLQKFGNRL